MTRNLLAVAALAAFTTACASTGAVPRPFPGSQSPQRPQSPRSPQSPQGSQGDRGSAGSPGAEGAEGSKALEFDAYALVGTALALRGTPYRNGGSDPSGFDCSGFTQYVFAHYGVALPREVREQYRQGQQIEPNELAPGDLVFFSTTDPGVSHVAIVIGSDQFVHAPSSSGVVRVERLRSSYWSQRYIGARRVVPVTTTQQ